MEFENKYLVIKREDVDKALEGIQRKNFWDAVDRISIMRNMQGKSENKYLVVNIDESYAGEVAKIMAANGHSGVSENKEGFECLTEFNASYEEEMKNALQDVMDMTELPSFNNGDVVGNPNESEEDFINRCLKKQRREEGE